MSRKAQRVSYRLDTAGIKELPFMDMDQIDVAQVTQFLDVKATRHAADLAFVFGTRLADPAPVAAGLFANGLVPYVVVTGGKNRITGLNEAQAHRRLLLQSGVPDDRIIVEDRSSTNTIENVVLALPLLEARIGLSKITAIAVVAKWYHCRRAMMTLRRHLPAGIRYYAQLYEPEAVPREGWHLQEGSRRPVLKEWQAIPYLLELGHIAEVREEDGAYV